MSVKAGFGNDDFSNAVPLLDRACPTTEKTVAIVDHRTLVRECLAQSLRHTMTVNEFESFDDFDLHADRATISLVLVHIPASDDTGLLQQLAKFIRCNATIPIITLVEDHASSHGKMGLLAVCTFMTERTPLEKTLSLVQFVQRDMDHVRRTINRHEPNSGAVEMPLASNVLTPRQMLIMHRLQRGDADKTIAHALDLSENTVKVHVRNILRRLKARNRTEAVHKAFSFSNRDISVSEVCASSLFDREASPAIDLGTNLSV